jgi:hypothetical protein
VIVRSPFTPPNAFRPANPFGGGSGRDLAPPTLVSVTVAADGQTWTLVFSEPVTETGYVGEFAFNAEFFGPDFLGYDSGSGTNTLVFSSAIMLAGEIITLSYAGAVIEDLAGNDLAEIIDRPVDNQSEQSP